MNPFGPMFAAKIRKRRVHAMRQHTHWRWHLDEVYVRVQGEMRYLWRAVDHEGEVLEAFVTKTRDKAAALKFMKKLMKRHGCAKAITPDGLRSYKAAMAELNIAERQEIGRWANNRAENSHQLAMAATWSPKSFSSPLVTLGRPLGRRNEGGGLALAGCFRPIPLPHRLP